MCLLDAPNAAPRHRSERHLPENPLWLVNDTCLVSFAKAIASGGLPDRPSLTMGYGVPVFRSMEHDRAFIQRLERECAKPGVNRRLVNRTVQTAGSPKVNISEFSTDDKGKACVREGWCLFSPCSPLLWV